MATSQEKILAYHMSRLRDKRPDVQMNAIEALEAMGADAEAAMDALKACFETSKDKDVQSAARQAAYNIFMAAKQAASGSEDSGT